VGYIVSPPLKKTASVAQREAVDYEESCGFSDATKVGGKSWKIFKWYVMKPCNQICFDL